MQYKRASFEPLRKSRYGIGFHWTTWTAPREGAPKSFEEAVEAFDVDAFVQQAVEAGAGHVLFTTTHAVHHLPGPNPEVDRLIAGRTCRRDLIMELAEGLARANILFVAYYNHGTWSNPFGGRQDPEWQDAAGAREADRTRYNENYGRILRWMGEHYGPRIAAYWFDSGYEFIKYPDTPWYDFTMAAKAGYADRLVTYNSGIDNYVAYTPYQDFWAGEVNRLDFRPDKPWPIEFAPHGPRTPGGLPWYAFTTWHKDPVFAPYGEWGINAENRDLFWAPPDPFQIMAYLTRFRHVGGVVTFNLLCYQDGSAYDTDLQAMKQVKALFKHYGRRPWARAAAEDQAAI